MPKIPSEDFWLLLQLCEVFLHNIPRQANVHQGLNVQPFVNTHFDKCFKCTQNLTSYKNVQKT